MVISSCFRVIWLIKIRFWHTTDHWEGLKYNDVLASSTWVLVWCILLHINHAIRTEALSIAVRIAAGLSGLLIQDGRGVARGASPCCSIDSVEPAEARAVLVSGWIYCVGDCASRLHFFAATQSELHLFAILGGFYHFFLLFWCFSQFLFSCAGQVTFDQESWWLDNTSWLSRRKVLLQNICFVLQGIVECGHVL